MFTEYLREAMATAKIEKIDDPLPYFASLPAFKGVWAQGKTKKEALAQLQEVLEEWLLVKVRKQQFVPTVRRYDLNALLAA
ncbi:MAG: type II toxin-antitoxin system HicB family antitoxin [Candidatus Peribacteraceae bacterium]|nr:type II toxin-antitoxin system HicB family antitoxin [Candidatus Peribacteraceae bacterium]